ALHQSLRNDSRRFATSSFFHTVHAMTAVGQSPQPFLGYGLAAALAAPKSPCLDALQRGIDFFQQMLFVIRQAKRDSYLKLMAALVGKIQGRSGNFIGGLSARYLCSFVAQVRESPLQPAHHAQQTPLVLD